MCRADAPKQSLTLQSIVKFRKRAERAIHREAINMPTRDGKEDDAIYQMRNSIALKCVREEWFEDCIKVGRE